MLFIVKAQEIISPLLNTLLLAHLEEVKMILSLFKVILPLLYNQNSHFVPFPSYLHSHLFLKCVVTE